MTGTKFIKQSEWNAFFQINAVFLRQISDTYKAENKNIYKTVISGKEGKLVLPLIVTLFAIGFDTLDKIKDLPIVVSKEKYEPCLSYLKEIKEDRESILFKIMSNWSKCPDILRKVYIEYNPGLNFPVMAYNPDIQNIKVEDLDIEDIKPGDLDIESSVVIEPFVSFSQYDLALAKFVNTYLIKFIGYNSLDDIQSTFVTKQVEEFYFRSKPSKVNGTQFRAHVNLIKNFARTNKELLNIGGDRIYFECFVDVLDKMEKIFPYTESVLSPEAELELYNHKINTTKSSSLVVIKENVSGSQNLPQDRLLQPSFSQPKINETSKEKHERIQTEYEKTNPVSLKANILKENKSQLTSIQKDVIELIVRTLNLDETQKSLIKAHIVNQQSLDYFLEVL